MGWRLLSDLLLGLACCAIHQAGSPVAGSKERIAGVQRCSTLRLVAEKDVSVPTELLQKATRSMKLTRLAPLQTPQPGPWGQCALPKPKLKRCDALDISSLSGTCSCTNSRIGATEWP